jgi:hypothetical protein
MATQGDYRARFAAAMNTNDKKRESEKELLFESFIGNATGNSKAGKQQLFDDINNQYFSGKCPWAATKVPGGLTETADGRVTMSSFSKGSLKSLYKYFSSNQGATDTLLNLGRDDNAIGAGEIMMAYLVENLTIGGGSSDVDLHLWNDKFSKIVSGGYCELKESNLSKGWLANWRTGAKHQGINSTYVPQLTAIYNAVKFSIPEINPETKAGKILTDKGGWINEWGTVGGKRFKHIENLTKEDIDLQSSKDRDFKIGPGEAGNVVAKYNGELLGNIGDAKTIEAIKNIIKTSGSTIKTFTQIQSEVIAAVGAISTPFLFIESKNGKVVNFHYYSSLPGDTSQIQIHSITQGKFKYKIKPNKV